MPCVIGRLFNIGHHTVPDCIWPVLRPSHEDSEYTNYEIKTTWSDVDGEWVESTKIDYVSDKMTQHHFHVDARFSPVENYTEYEINNSDWHTIISPKSEIEYRYMVCLREMPVQRLFTGFGEKFVQDYLGKELKCLRCPHKGIDLKSISSQNGILTCPGHGLKFDATRKCVI